MNPGIYGLPPGERMQEWGPFPVVFNSRQELAHSLPGEPTRFTGLLICKIAQHDWLVGDRLPITLPWIQYQAGFGIGIYLRPGIVGVRIMNSGVGIHTNATTATTTTITAANWDVIIRAWL